LRSRRRICSSPNAGGGGEGRLRRRCSGSDHGSTSTFPHWQASGVGQKNRERADAPRTAGASAAKLLSLQAHLLEIRRMIVMGATTSTASNRGGTTMNSPKRDRGTGTSETPEVV